MGEEKGRGGEVRVKEGMGVEKVFLFLSFGGVGWGWGGGRWNEWNGEGGRVCMICMYDLWRCGRFCSLSDRTNVWEKATAGVNDARVADCEAYQCQQHKEGTDSSRKK